MGEYSQIQTGLKQSSGWGGQTHVATSNTHLHSSTNKWMIFSSKGSKRSKQRMHGFRRLGKPSHPQDFLSHLQKMSISKPDPGNRWHHYKVWRKSHRKGNNPEKGRHNPSHSYHAERTDGNAAPSPSTWTGRFSTCRILADHYFWPGMEKGIH